MRLHDWPAGEDARPVRVLKFGGTSVGTDPAWLAEVMQWVASTRTLRAGAATIGIAQPPDWYLGTSTGRDTDWYQVILAALDQRN